MDTIARTVNMRVHDTGEHGIEFVQQSDISVASKYSRMASKNQSVASTVL